MTLGKDILSIVLTGTVENRFRIIKKKKKRLKIMPGNKIFKEK